MLISFILIISRVGICALICHFIISFAYVWSLPGLASVLWFVIWLFRLIIFDYFQGWHLCFYLSCYYLFGLSFIISRVSISALICRFMISFAYFWLCTGLASALWFVFILFIFDYFQGWHKCFDLSFYDFVCLFLLCPGLASVLWFVFHLIYFWLFPWLTSLLWLFILWCLSLVFGYLQNKPNTSAWL